jgi:precorrin-3B synthase
MNMPAIKGWCPGALRPMASGDGLIVRLKLTGGIVPVDLAMQIAEWSRRFGNGEIDLTARANLQLRGITDESLPGLQQAIADAGLLDENPDGEAIRNVIASPLAGLDPDAWIDIRPMVAALETRLTSDPKLYGLPAKFCFAVDDGGQFDLSEVQADIRFEAVAGGGFSIQLDGALDELLGPCRGDELVDVAVALAKACVDDGKSVCRMRDLVERIGAAAIVKGASLPLFCHSRESGKPFRASAQMDGRIPAFAGMTKGVLGVGLPFGRVSAHSLRHLVEQAAKAGATELRLTPWRAILIPCPSAEAAKRLIQPLPPDVFILDPADPRRRVAACVGAPACRSATTSVRDDAGRLASLTPETTSLHVSGCAKGCAHPRPASVTLVGNNGLYDLICDGAPADSPALRSLTLDEAAAYLRQMAATQIQDPAV